MDRHTSYSMNYRHINNWAGWLVFTISAAVYIITSEPTTSWWDCGEYIATAAGLQVGHPPGAPLFQLIGRFFSLFSFGNDQLIARMVNTMSALCSAFTILFLYWTITRLTKKLLERNPGLISHPTVAIIGSGLIGSLAYAFTDSFWFSAVEGEVYAMSSFFTAFVFWAILKWEEEVDINDVRSLRWIILIAFMIGLSIGVHLLNLLTIPAITLVYYFKKYKPTFKGITLTLVISVILLALVMNLIIPWIVKLAGLFELFFVNSLKLSFNTGTIIYFVLLIGLTVWGLVYTRKRRKVIWNTIILSFSFILIGYSSFFMIVIRSNANTPINENEPTHAISLLAYLNREQYGDWPLLYGPYYNAPVVDYSDASPVYHKNRQKGIYEIINERKSYDPVYHEDFMTIFPRMWSATENSHKYFYQRWGEVKGNPITITDTDGTQQTINKPTFGENLRFFFDYQIQFMYVRYFMWNFAGRQNDRQGLGDDLNGNWISGINFIDEARIGPQSNLPDNLNSKAHNKYYFLPLILGLIGLLFHISKNAKDSLVVTLLFVMTGIAIVVYLNQYAPQPRERDYAYAASFYAFSIWIGIGVLAIAHYLNKLFNLKQAGTIATAICMVVPGILIAENWNDHDRSDRYTAREIAYNYLQSCEKNAIIFTVGDNDTFPLWYAQEVEGIRTDVRVVNLSLLNSHWYIDQMKRKVHDSEPLPISLNFDQFKSGTFDVMFLAPNERFTGYVQLLELFEVMHKQPDALKVKTSIGLVDVIPANKFILPVDTNLVRSNGTVQPDEMNLVLPSLEWTVDTRALTKNQIIALDIIAHNNWERPIYFSATAGSDSYLGLDSYLRNEGFALRLVPVKKEMEEAFDGYIHSDVLYKNLMQVYKYRNIDNPDVYLDETSVRLINNMRTLFGRLAKKLAEEGRVEEAIKVADRCLQIAPNESVPFNYYLLQLAESLLVSGADKKADELLKILLNNYTQNLDYYFSFPAAKLKILEQDISQSLMVVNGIASMANEHGNHALKEKATLIMDKYFEKYEEAGF